MAYDQSALAMLDSPALRNFPPRLADISSLRGSSIGNNAGADEVNAKGLDPRQQYQNSFTASAQRASQSAGYRSNYSVITGQPSAGKRPREQAAALPPVVPLEAGHHRKLARIETEEQLQSQSQQQQEQEHLPQFHDQRQQQQQLEQEQQPMDFMGMEDMGIDFSEELLSSSSGAEFDTEVPPPRPEMGVRREIFFADFF